MNFVLRTYTRFRQLIHEFAKFGVVGVIGLVITNGGYDVLTRGGVGPVTATTIATIIATAVAYVGNRYWSFAQRERTGVVRETVIFFALNGIGLLIQDAVVGFNAHVLGYQGDHHRVEQFVALNFGIALATVFRWWSYRRFVFLAPPAPAAATAPNPATGGPGTGGSSGATGGGPGTGPNRGGPNRGGPNGGGPNGGQPPARAEPKPQPAGRRS